MTFGKHGSVVDHTRYMQPVNPTSRRRCMCGCKQRALHLGMANGVCLVVGCELSIRRWVRDGIKASTVKNKAIQEAR